MWRWLLVSFIAVALGACQPSDTQPTLEADSGVQAKLLATVYISPTPSPAEQQATQAALRPTLTSAPPTIQPTPTVYVGVFLQGVSDENDAEAPILDATEVFALIPDLATAIPSRCQIPEDAVFGETWRSDPFAGQSLGCAIEELTRFDGIVQIFEHGVMYFQSNGPIWAIETTNDGFPDRQWTITQNLPPVENPESIVTPPDGLRVPLLGFGAVWFGVEGVRDTLGFARTEEQPVDLAYQRFEGGTLFKDLSTDTVFVLLPDGRAFGPF